MKRMRFGSTTLALFAALTLFAAGCASGGSTAGSAAGGGAAGAAAKGTAAPEGYRYFCNCGPECNCGSSSVNPGNCGCGKPMVQKRILSQDDANYYVCGCTDCACNAKHPRNGSQCSCGKPLKAFPKQRP